MNYKVGWSFSLQEIPSSYNILFTQFKPYFLGRPIWYLLMQIWWSRWWTCVMGKRVKSNCTENKHTLLIITAFYTSPTCKVAPNLHTIILYVSLSLLTWDSSSYLVLFTFFKWIYHSVWYWPRGSQLTSYFSPSNISWVSTIVCASHCTGNTKMNHNPYLVRAYNLMGK